MSNAVAVYRARIRAYGAQGLYPRSNRGTHAFYFAKMLRAAQCCSCCTTTTAEDD